MSKDSAESKTNSLLIFLYGLLPIALAVACVYLHSCNLKLKSEYANFKEEIYSTILLPQTEAIKLLNEGVQAERRSLQRQHLEVTEVMGDVRTLRTGMFDTRLHYQRDMEAAAAAESSMQHALNEARKQNDALTAVIKANESASIEQLKASIITEEQVAHAKTLAQLEGKKAEIIVLNQRISGLEAELLKSFDRNLEASKEEAKDLQVRTAEPNKQPEVSDDAIN